MVQESSDIQDHLRRCRSVSVARAWGGEHTNVANGNATEVAEERCIRYQGGSEQEDHEGIYPGWNLVCTDPTRILAKVGNDSSLRSLTQKLDVSYKS